MMEPEEFEGLLNECASTFDNADPRYWHVLLERAAIDFDPSTGRISFDEDDIAVKLRGYEWLRQVPREVDAAE